tara:strand:+ start:15167 stop:16063 length:897 start_codon:yes stop_codon:yes gene_type:complete
MITSIVFSKDRPLQLDLCLKSIKQNLFADNKIIVLYKISTDDYQTHYNKLKEEHEDVDFVSQGYSIFEDIKNLVRNSSDYITFFTDDDIVFRPVLFKMDKVHDLFHIPYPPGTFSLRMGLNTRARDYGDGVPAEDVIPDKVYKMAGGDEDFLLWNRTSVPVGGYWSYPLSVDGHIFMKNLIAECCEELCHLYEYYNNRGIPREQSVWENTPNEFESKLQRFYFSITPNMASPEFSCVVNSPNNRVQDHMENRSGDKHSFSAEYLLQIFADGSRIDLDSLNFDGIDCPHTEINIMEGLV